MLNHYNSILSALRSFCPTAHIGGGAVRDTLLQRPIKDIDYRAFFPKNYFEASDLNGGPLTLTIAGIDLEKMPGAEQKPCIRFEEDRRRLVLGATNAKMLELLSGSDDTSDAVGLRVQLTQVDTSFQGGPRQGIRFARPRPQPAAKGDGGPDDTVPF